MAVRIFCQPIDCCGLGPCMTGDEYDISDNHLNGADMTLF